MAGMAVAIKTTTSMVLISIQPFGLRKLVLILAALLCFSVMCFADPVLMAHRYVPAPGVPEMKTDLAAPEKLRGADLWHVVDPASGRGFRALDLPLRDQRPLLGIGQINEQLLQAEPVSFFPQTV
jgi:hypothetical protein